MRILPGSVRLALFLSGLALLDGHAASGQTSSPSLTTTPGGTVTLGTGINLTDSATLSGGLNPTGTITFELFDPSDNLIDSETVPVNGNGAYNTITGYLPTLPGTYQWLGIYSGDPNNSAFTEGGPSETELALITSPSLGTTPGGTVTIGTGINLTDSATLSGGLNPTGTITFELFDPSDNLIDAESVPVNGNGTYNTITGFLPTVPGTYQWLGMYSGDPNNSAFTEGGPSETELVVVQTVPEPPSCALFGVALGMLCMALRLRRTLSVPT